MIYIQPPPNLNFSLRFGDGIGSVTVNLQVPKTWRNRLKWWMFCQFFPGKIVKWEK